MNRGKLMVLGILISSLIIIAPTSLGNGTDEPFSIQVEPNKFSINPGEEISFSVKIEAVEGFAGSIDLELDLSTVGYSDTLDFGTLNQPYPKEHEFTVNIPAEIPVGKIQGTLRGTSGDHVVEEDIEITLQGNGGIIGAIILAISNIWDSILRLFGIK